MIIQGKNSGKNAVSSKFYGLVYDGLKHWEWYSKADSSQAADDLKNWQNKMYDNGLVRSAQPVLAFTEDEQEEWAEKYVVVQKHFVQNIDKFIMGVRPMEEWDDFLAELKKLGIPELIMIREAQYERASGK